MLPFSSIRAPGASLTLALVPALALLLGACTMSETGDDGRATFQVSGSSSCILGCDPASTPLAVGAQETMTIHQLPSAGGLSVVSDNPAMLTVGSAQFSSTCSGSSCGATAGSFSVPITAVASGGANVIVKQEDGTVYDQVYVSVHAATGASVQVSGKSVTSLSLSVGGKESVQTSLLDSSGATLLADGVMAVWSPESQVLDVGDAVLGSEQLQGVAAGQTTLDVGTSGAPLVKLPVTVK